MIPRGAFVRVLSESCLKSRHANRGSSPAAVRRRSTAPVSKDKKQKTKAGLSMRAIETGVQVFPVFALAPAITEDREGVLYEDLKHQRR